MAVARRSLVRRQVRRNHGSRPPRRRSRPAPSSRHDGGTWARLDENSSFRARRTSFFLVVRRPKTRLEPPCVGEMHLCLFGSAGMLQGKRELVVGLRVLRRQPDRFPELLYRAGVVPRLGFFLAHAYGKRRGLRSRRFPVQPLGFGEFTAGRILLPQLLERLAETQVSFRRCGIVLDRQSKLLDRSRCIPLLFQDRAEHVVSLAVIGFAADGRTELRRGVLGPAGLPENHAESERRFGQG